MRSYLGIDTSAYTTSLALVDEEHHVLLDERLLLKVESGERGLRQSEALFAHIKNLPVLFKKAEAALAGKNIRALGVSSAPRNIEESYMPVFLAGLAVARSVSSFNSLPLFEVSHQDGHVMAGLLGNQALLKRPGFLAVHFSGGTSELLVVKKADGDNPFAIEIAASGLDLHAGQLVDRVGVAMGLPFPSGPAMEELARRFDGENPIELPSFVREDGFSFSGIENRSLLLIKEGADQAALAFALLRAIANTLEKIILIHAQKTGIKDVLLVGGVMANLLIRERLIKRLEHPAINIKTYFAESKLSSDNAVGTALLASYLHDNGSWEK